MFDVIACGYTPALLESHPASRGITVLPEPTSADFLDLGYEALAARGRDGAALLIAPATVGNRRRLATLRAAVRSDEILGVSLARPLTSLAATATLLASLAARGLAPGVAVSYLTRHLPQLLPTYAATTSVAHLDLPEMRISHHLLSWVPGIGGKGWSAPTIPLLDSSPQAGGTGVANAPGQTQAPSWGRDQAVGRGGRTGNVVNVNQTFNTNANAQDIGRETLWAIGGVVGGRLFEATGSYDMVWMIAIGLGVLSAALHWPIDERPLRLAAA